MRRIVVDNRAIPVDDPKRQRNVDSHVVGENKAREERLAERRKKRKTG